MTHLPLVTRDRLIEGKKKAGYESRLLIE